MNNHNLGLTGQGFRHIKIKHELGIGFNLLAFPARGNDRALPGGVIAHSLEGDLIGQAAELLHDLKADSLGFTVNIDRVDQLHDFIIENLFVFADQFNLCMILNQIQLIVFFGLADGFSQRSIRSVVDISLGKGERIAAVFAGPHLSDRYGQRIALSVNLRNLGHTVAGVCRHLRAVLAAEFSAGNVRGRHTRGIVASFHHNRVAGRVRAISIEDIICLGAGRFDDRIAADLESACFLINRSRALDRTAADAQRRSVRMIDRNVIIRYDLAARDADRVSAVAGVTDAADRVSVLRVHLAAVDGDLSALALSDNRPLAGFNGSLFDRQLSSGVRPDAPGSRGQLARFVFAAVRNSHLAVQVDSAARGCDSLAIQVKNHVLPGFSIAGQLTVFQQDDRIAVFRRRKRFLQAGVIGGLIAGDDLRAGFLNCLFAFRGGVHPDIASRRRVVKAGRFDDGYLICGRFERCLRGIVHHDVAREGSARQLQSEAILRVAAGCIDLNVAVDLAAALDFDFHRRVAGVPAHIERIAARRIRVDRRTVNHDAAVVVRQRIGAAVAGIVQRQRHAIQRQIAVVLHQDLRLRRRDRSVCKCNLIVPQQLEAVRFRSSAANHGSIHCVGMSRKVHRQAIRKLALRSLDSVSAAVFQQRDRLSVLRRRNRRFKAGIACFTNRRYRLRDRLGSFFSIHPHIAFRRRVVKAGRLGDGYLRRSFFKRRFRGIVHHDVAREGSARQLQSEAILRVAAGCIDLNVAVDLAAALDFDFHRRVAGVPAHIERIAARRIRVDRRTVNHDAAVVVRQRIGAAVAGIVQRQRHAIQRQIAVVLHQDLRLRRRDRSVCKCNLIVPQQLEAVRFRSSAANRGSIHRVSISSKVNRQAGCELALRNLDSVAAAVFQQRDRVSVFRCRNCRFKAGIARFANLRHGLRDRLGSFPSVHPHIAFRRRVVKASRLGDGYLLRGLFKRRFSGSVHHDLTTDASARQRQPETILRVVTGCRYFNFAVDCASAGYRYMHRRIAAVPAHIERIATRRIRVDRRIVDHDIAVIVRQRIGTAVAGIVQRQRHFLQRQIAVVLNQNLRLCRSNCTVLKRDLIVLQQLEAVRFRSRAADRGSIHRVGISRKVHRQAGSELALRHHDSVAAAIAKQSDRSSVFRSRKGLFKAFILLSFPVCGYAGHKVRRADYIEFIDLIINVAVIEQIGPIVIVCLPFILVCQGRKRTAGNKSFRCIITISIYIA